jgi:hypothetical protein
VGTPGNNVSQRLRNNVMKKYWNVSWFARLLETWLGNGFFTYGKHDYRKQRFQVHSKRTAQEVKSKELYTTEGDQLTF